MNRLVPAKTEKCKHMQGTRCSRAPVKGNKHRARDVAAPIPVGAWRNQKYGTGLSSDDPIHAKCHLIHFPAHIKQAVAPNHHEVIGRGRDFDHIQRVAVSLIDIQGGDVFISRLFPERLENRLHPLGCGLKGSEIVFSLYRCSANGNRLWALYPDGVNDAEPFYISFVPMCETKRKLPGSQAGSRPIKGNKNTF
jgi:hypothetical protein